MEAGQGAGAEENFSHQGVGDATDSRDAEAPAEPTAPQTESVQQGESAEAGQGAGVAEEFSHQGVGDATEGAGETKLYRVMSDAEYQSIISKWRTPWHVFTIFYATALRKICGEKATNSVKTLP